MLQICNNILFKKNIRCFQKAISIILIVSLLLTHYSFLVPFVYAASSPWTQTDWVGGSGQTNWSDETKYDSSSNITTSTAGQVTLTNSEELSNTGFESNLTGWSTGATPDSISGLQLWLKADAITGASDGDSVTTWSDSSGNSRDVTQSVTANKPTYKTNILNSKPVIRFNGSTTFFSGGDILDLGTDDHSGIVVGNIGGNAQVLYAKSVAAGAVGRIGMGRDDGSGGLYGLHQNGAGVQLVFGTYTSTSYKIFDYILNRSAGSSRLYTNGAQFASKTYTAESTNYNTTYRFLVGAYNNATDTGQISYLNGDIAEVIIYNNALSTANRSRLENYLRDKYGITVTSGITSATRDTTTTYASSTGSAKLVTATADTGEFTQSVNVGDTNIYNLSAYAYTTGAAVTSSDVELFYNGSTVSTTYTSVGSGWYQLTGTVTGANASRQYGVQVKTNKTVYIDNVSLNSYGSSGTLTSSIFDAEALANWGTLIYTATTPSNTSISVKVRTSNSPTMTGATDFSACNAISSGSDISNNNCVTDKHQYIQYQLSLTNTNSVFTPTFQDLSLGFNLDNTIPSISLTPLTPDPNTDSTPTISGTATEAVGVVTAVQFQMDSTNGSWSSCTADDGTFDEDSEAFTCTPTTALSDGAHTMYVRSTDSNGNTTSSGSESSDAFTIDTIAPISFELDSPGDNSYTNNERPTFRWKVPNAPDATTSLANYTLDVDNGDPGDSGQVSGDFSIGSIPTSGTTDIETSKYIIHFDNFNDSDTTNNYISVRTKSSSDWTSSENYGKLKEGRRGWTVRATDGAGNTRTEGRTLFVDKTNPSIEVTQVNSTPCQTSACSMATTDKTPTVFGKLTDPLGGVDYGQTQSTDGPKVASGPKSIEVRLEKKNNVGMYDLHSLVTVNLNESYWTHDDTRITDNTLQTSNKYSTFSFTPDTELTLGAYRIILYGKDNVDQNSETKTIYLTIGSYTQVTTTEERQVVDEEIKTLTPTQQETLKQELEITKPVEPSKPSVFETTSNWIFLTIQNLLGRSNDIWNTMLAVWSTNWTSYTNVISTLAYGVIQGGEFVVNTTSNMAMTIGQALAFVFDNVSQGLAHVFNATGNALVSLGELASQVLSFVTGTLRDIASVIGQGFLTLLNGINQGLAHIGENYNRLADMTPGVTRTILNGVGSGVNQISMMVGGVVQTLANNSRESNEKTMEFMQTITRESGIVIGNLAIETGNVIQNTSKSINTLNFTIATTITTTTQATSKTLSDTNKNIINSSKDLIANASFAIGQKLSGFSNNISNAIVSFGYLFATEPTRISDVKSVVLGPTSVKISWQTNHPASGKVNWGYEDGVYEFEIQTDKKTNEHEFILTNLKPDTQYHYEVLSHNKNFVYDANRKFKTTEK